MLLAGLLSATRGHMMRGEVADAAELLMHSWTTARISGSPGDVTALHNTSLELADRFPCAEPVSDLLYCVTATYVRSGDLRAATVTAARMVAVWRARCQADPNADSLVHHAHALDTLAGVYRERGRSDGIAACLVELVEWHATWGSAAGVAWGLRELGALAFLAGDLDDAQTKFTRADALHAGDAEDVSVSRERAECHVLLGRVSQARNDGASARRWFTRALRHLSEDAAREVRQVVDALDSGVEPPEPVHLVVGEFGRPLRAVG